MGRAKLTEAQRRALRHLASVNWCSPASLGEAMSDQERLKAQGAGRIGGSMGGRLVKMGLAARHLEPWPGHGMCAAGYEITTAGRAALEREP